eukprot:TRINITY_DN1375_c1_g1_i1.p1 TRINITY_DN1375_c1_g1~~TRINITY_DN1375_c1_g1_i1.p1  ORF type:complete len:1226 (+),score=178.04 TRINITY_DN1375_c1_g1_i1:59-3679(+)
MNPKDDDHHTSLLEKHGVVPHATGLLKSPTRKANNPRKGTTMLARDGAVSLLQMLTDNLDSLKASLGTRRHKIAHVVSVIDQELVEIMMNRSMDSDIGLAALTGTSTHEGLIQAVVEAADVTGSGLVTWDDVLTLMIDAGMKGRTVDLNDTFKGYGEVQNNQAEKLSAITSFKYIPERQLGLVCEGSQLRWVNISPSGSGVVPTAKVMSLPSNETRGTPPSVVAFDYLHPHQSVVAGCGDLSIVLLNSETGAVVQQLSCDTTTTTVNFIDNKLYSGDRDGRIWLWQIKRENARGDTEKAKAGNVAIGATLVIEVVRKVSVHKGAVTGIVLAASHGCLVSASADQTLVVITPAGEIIRSICYPNSVPFNGIVYSPEADVIVTCGSSPDLMVWLLSNASTSKPFLLSDTQRPHVGSLCGLVVIPGTQQVVSCDARGGVKIWCLSRYACLQSIQCGVQQAVSRKHQAPVRSLAFASHCRMLVVSSAVRSWIFEYDAAVGLRTSANDSPVTSVHFCSSDNTIVTTGGRTIRVWALSTGKMLAKYEIQHDINACCLSEDGNYIIIGGPSGVLSIHSMASGKKLRDIHTRHNADITNLTFCPGKNALLSTAWNGSVMMTTLDEERYPRSIEAGFDAWAPLEAKTSPVSKRSTRRNTLHTLNVLQHDDIQAFQASPERASPQRGKEIDGKCTAYSPLLHLCAIGDSLDSITLWSTTTDQSVDLRPLAKCQSEAALRNAEKSILRDITAVTFIYHYPVVVASNSLGSVHVWSVAPYQYPNQCLAWWTTTHNHVAVGVSCMAQAKDDLTKSIFLYTGDDEGFLSCYNIGLLLSEYGIHNSPIQPQYPEPSKHVIHRVKRWRAHASAVLSCHVIQKHNLIVTSGQDRQVTVWSFFGQLVGSLDQNGLAPYKVLVRKPVLFENDIPIAALQPKDYHQSKQSVEEQRDSPQNDGLDVSMIHKPKIQPKYKMGGRKGIRRPPLGNRRSSRINDGASCITDNDRLTRRGSLGGTTTYSALPGDLSVAFKDDSYEKRKTSKQSRCGSPTQSVSTRVSTTKRSIKLPTLAETISAVSLNSSSRQKSKSVISSSPTKRSKRRQSMAPAPPSEPPQPPARSLPEGYLEILSNLHKDVTSPSILTTNDTPGKEFISPTLAALPPGSHEYHARSKKLPRETIQVEVTNRLTGRSKIMHMQQTSNPPVSRDGPELPWWEELEKFSLT